MPDTQTPPHPPHPHEKKPPRRRLFPHFRYSAVELLVSLVLLFVASPFVEGMKNGPLIEAILVSLVLVSTVLAIRARPRTLALTVSLMALAVGGKWMNHFRPDLVSPQMFLVPSIAVVSLVVVCLTRYILTAPHVNREVLCAGLANFLMLGMLWSLACVLLAILDPNAFEFNTGPPSSHSMTGFDAFYYSFVVLTTLGFGDVTPVSDMARMLAITESTTGLLYVAVMISRLVALHITHHTPPTHSDKKT